LRGEGKQGKGKKKKKRKRKREGLTLCPEHAFCCGCTLGFFRADMLT
jgi:hypothetical protein